MPEGSSAGELDLCPECRRRTLLSEPSPHGHLVCLRCGVISAARDVGDARGPENGRRI